MKTLNVEREQQLFMMQIHSVRSTGTFISVHFTVTALISIDISIHEKLCKLTVSSNARVYIQFPVAGVRFLHTASLIDIYGF